MKNELYISMGGRIRAARRKRGVHQWELAERTGVSAQHISNIEVGTKAPSYERLYRIADVLKCPVYSLMPAGAREEAEFLSEELRQMLRRATPYQKRIILRGAE